MAKEIPVKIKVDTEGAERSLEDFKNEIESLKKEIESTPIGNKKFDELAGKLQKAQSEVKTLEKTMEGLEPQQKAEAFLKMGEGIVGGFTAAQGAMALLGQEDTKLQETMLKVQSAVAIAQGARMISEGLLNASIAKRLIMEKASVVQTLAMSAAMGAYNLVVGTSSGVLKAFRLALIGTGIGAFVVGLGLLIANFDKVSEYVMKAVDAFLEFAKPVKEFLQSLGIIDSEEEALLEKQIERNEKKKEMFGEEEKARKHQIELAKLQGKSEEELFKLEEKLAYDKFELNRRIVADKMKLGEEITKEEREQLNESRQALELLRAQRQAAVQKELEDERKKAEDLRKQRAKEYADYIKQINTQLVDARIEGIKDATEKEIETERINLERKLAAIKGNSKIEEDLRAQLRANSNARIAEIQAKADADALAKEKEDRLKAMESEFKDNIAKQESYLLNESLNAEQRRTLQAELYALQRDQQLSQEGLTNGERLKIKAEYEANITELEKQAENERLELQKTITEAKLNIAQNSLNGLKALGELAIGQGKRQEAFQKSLAIAQLAIDTARSISSTIAGATAAAAAGGPAAPFLLAGYIASGVATVLTAFASASKILKSAPTTQSPSLQGASQGVANGVQPQGLQNTDNTPRTRLEESQGLIKAYVVETEITQKQNQVTRIEQGATI